MLNDMSETDPEKYESFIKEQMDEADKPSARTFTPSPKFVVKTKFAKAKGIKIKVRRNENMTFSCLKL